MPRGWRDSKAFEQLTVRMLFLIGLGTCANLGYLVHLKSSGQFVPLELERYGYDNNRREAAAGKGGSTQ